MIVVTHRLAERGLSQETRSRTIKLDIPGSILASVPETFLFDLLDKHQSFATQLHNDGKKPTEHARLHGVSADLQ